MAGAIVALAALLYLLTGSGHLQSGDFRSELAVAQSMLAGSFEVRPSLANTYVPSVTGRDHRQYSKYGLGMSLLLLPAAAAGRLAGCPADPARCPAAAQRVAETVASFTNGLLAALAVGLLFLLALDLGAGLVPAAALALLFGFATLQWDYAHDAFDVGPTALFFLAAAYACRRAARLPGAWWPLLAGSAAGFTVLLRVADAATLPLFGVYLVAAALPGRRKALESAGLFTLATLAALALIAAYNTSRFGTPLQTGYGLSPDTSGFTNPFPAGVAGLLLSPGKSLFVYSPILVAALLGWPALHRRDRLFTLLLAAVSLETLLLYASYLDWSGDWAWGPRYLVPILPFLILPLLPLLERWRELPGPGRALLLAVSALSVVAAFLGVAVEFLHQMIIEVLAGTDLSKAYWIPAKSAVWIHLQTLGTILNGHAYYPPYSRAGDLATGTPPLTTLDFWWIYELAKGTNPVIVLTVVGALGYLGFRSGRRLRRLLGGSPLPHGR